MNTPPQTINETPNTMPATPLRPTRILHTMLRVGDLERSVNFYCNRLGMRELRREDYPSGAFTLVFLGYGDETDTAVIELTYNYGDADYSQGSGFGHIALAVQDIYSTCQYLQERGVNIVRAPGPMAHIAHTGQRDVIAFIEDPDGYRIELIECA